MYSKTEKYSGQNFVKWKTVLMLSSLFYLCFVVHMTEANEGTEEVKKQSKDKTVVEESALDQNPLNSHIKDQTLNQREGLDSLTEKDSTDSFAENEAIRDDTKHHSQRAPRVDTQQAEGPESETERSNSEQSEKLDEGLKSNEEVFERIKNFKKIHGRLPDLDNADEKREITGVTHQKENGIITDQVTEDDFPSPFLKEELDADQIEEIFSSLDNNVKTTTVVYKSDEHGNVRVQRYTQTRHEDGVYTTDVYEGTNEMSENQNAEEQYDAEQSYGDDEDQFFQNPEDFFQDSEDMDQGNREDSSGSFTFTLVSKSPPVFLFVGFSCEEHKITKDSFN